MVENSNLYAPQSKGDVLYNYYARLLKHCKPNLFAIMIDLGFSTHKRINIRLQGLDYHKDKAEDIMKFCEKFFKDTDNRLMYFSSDPDDDGYMVGVIKNHNGVFNLNKLLVDNGLMFEK